MSKSSIAWNTSSQKTVDQITLRHYHNSFTMHIYHYTQLYNAF